MTRPRSGDRVPHGEGWLEIVHVGVGAVVVRELDLDFRPTRRVVEALTVEGWRAEKIGPAENPLDAETVRA